MSQSKEHREAISDRDWWQQAGDVLGLKLFGFTYRAIGAFRDPADNDATVNLTGKVAERLTLLAPLPIVDEVATFTFHLHPMAAAPTGPDAMEPAEIEIHEGSWAVVLGTNAKAIGWIDTHALFDGRTYRASLVSPPTQAGGEPEPVPVAWRAKSYSRYAWAYGETVAIACEKACSNSEEVIEKLEPLYAAPIASKEACGDGVSIRNLLSDLHSILVVTKGEWSKQSSWSEWDESVYQRLLSMQAALEAARTPNPGAAE